MSVKRELTDADIREYCRSGGAKCPYCGSDDLQGTEVSIEGNYAFQEVSCTRCFASWSDVRQLVGLNPTDAPEVDESEFESASETAARKGEPASQKEYLVTWQIDMDGDTAQEAACKALIVQRDNDPANTANSFTVQDKETGEVTEVDLGEDQSWLKN